MITSAFLILVINSINYLVSKLPSISVDSHFVSTMTTVSEYVSAIHSILPTITISVLSILAIDIAFEAGYLLFKAVYWIIRRFPTQS